MTGVVLNKYHTMDLWLSFGFVLIIIGVPVQCDGGFNAGCYNENIYLHKSHVFAGSVELCVEACERLYYSYAVLNTDNCLCANKLPEHELNSEQCNIPCKEISTQICGGFGAQSYYSTDVQVAGPPTSLFVLNSSDSSITLRWQHPEAQMPSSLNQYVIRAVIIQTYATNQVPQPREWIVQKDSATKFELVNLLPGTKYNITITSRSDAFGDGGSNSILSETIIGVPAPEPEQPHIILRNGQQLEIEIPNPINYNGPINQIQIVVIFVDSELSQSFDERLLVHYNQAQEDGTSYYIAAELNYMNGTRRFTIGDGQLYNGYLNAPLPTDRHVHVSMGIISRVGGVLKKRYANVTSHEQHSDHKEIVSAVGHEEEDDDNDMLVTFLIAGCVLFAILLILTSIAYAYIRIKTERRMRRLPSDHHELTLQGPIVDVENNGAYQPDEYLKGNYDKKLNDLLSQIDATKRHPRNVLSLEINNIIGNGSFGDLIRGHLNKEPAQVHVISDDMEPLDQMQFLKDFSQIQKIGAHSNILNFYGICQTADWLYLLFEDIPFTLKKKLLDGRLPLNVNAQRYSSITEKSVLQILCDIANAMEYLSMYEFVHKKLCAHNIRINSNNQVKVSCFGATPYDDHGKQIDLSRWSAPEVLRFQHYSDRGDVWSFGCLMWETCCLGATPYANVSAGDLANRIKAGARPERVPFVFDDMHHLFVNCWEVDPSERPSFSDISHTLRQLLTSPLHVLSYNRQENVTLPYYLPLLEMQTV